MHSFEISLGYESVELHFQHEALPRFIENVLRSTLSYPSETSKECIQFLIKLLLLFFNLTFCFQNENKMNWMKFILKLCINHNDLYGCFFLFLQGQSFSFITWGQYFQTMIMICFFWVDFVPGFGSVSIK